MIEKLKKAVHTYFSLLAKDEDYEHPGYEFIDNHDHLIDSLNHEQKKRVQEIRLNQVRLPISAITLVIITSNNGMLLNR